MKIAFVTDEGEELKRHFGQAGNYLVVTVADGHEVARELRAKPVHRHGDEDEHFDRARLHGRMLEPIRDCELLVAGGIGIPLQQKAQAAGINVLLTRKKQINHILQEYLDGTLQHEEGLAHRPRH